MGSFKRVEKKYIVDDNTVKAFIDLLGDKLSEFEYGFHTICNIYYDTDDNELIRRSLDKPIYKEKFRLRSYGTPTDTDLIYLEIKKKYDGVVYKRRVKMPYDVALSYLNEDIYPTEYDCQILREIDYFLKNMMIKPAISLCYDRMAYYITDIPDIRITVDQNIRSRRENLRLGAMPSDEKLLDDNIRVIEIKASQNLPLWFVEAMSKLSILPNSFSKYGKIYEKEKAVSLAQEDLYV